METEKYRRYSELHEDFEYLDSFPLGCVTLHNILTFYSEYKPEDVLILNTEENGVSIYIRKNK